MSVRRRFLIALMVSVVLHGVLVAASDWRWASLDELLPPEPPTTVDARLLPPRPIAPTPMPPSRRPRPAVARQVPAPTFPAPVAAEPASAATATADPPPPAPPVMEEVAAVPAPEPPPPARAPWGGKGLVRFSAAVGSLGFVIGTADHEWQAADGRYRLRWTFDPSVPLARTRTMISEGELTGDGLRPRRFSDQKEGREPETASFDWEAGRVSFSAGRGEAPLPAGTADLLSMLYQLAWRMPREDVTMTIASGSRVGRWTFRYLGEETLELAVGPTATVHLRAEAEGEITEVWYATARGGLLVKIRRQDRKGDVFEQVAESIEMDGIVEGAR